MIQRFRSTPYKVGVYMADHGGSLRGLPFGPGPAQDAAIQGFNDAMAKRKAPQPLYEVDLGENDGVE